MASDDVRDPLRADRGAGRSSPAGWFIACTCLVAQGDGRMLASGQSVTLRVSRP